MGEQLGDLLFGAACVIGPIGSIPVALLVPLMVLLWMPRSAYSQRTKLHLVGLFSLIALIFWGIEYYVYWIHRWDESWEPFLLWTIPLIAVGDVLLLLGGRVLRFIGVLAWLGAGVINLFYMFAGFMKAATY